MADDCKVTLEINMHDPESVKMARVVGSIDKAEAALWQLLNHTFGRIDRNDELPDGIANYADEEEIEALKICARIIPVIIREVFIDNDAHAFLEDTL